MAETTKEERDACRTDLEVVEEEHRSHVLASDVGSDRPVADWLRILSDADQCAVYEVFLKRTTLTTSEGPVSLFDMMLKEDPEAEGEDEESLFTIFRGRRVLKTWPQKLVNAQKFLSVHDRETGQAYTRIAFTGLTDSEICHDCAAMNGELHVPGCDVERCPKCHGQAITCGHRFREDEEAVEEFVDHITKGVGPT